MSEGCYARLADLRVATIVGPLDLDLQQPLRLEPGEVMVPHASGADDMGRQLDRLEVQPGDILVVRTRRKLQPAKATAWQDELIRLCKSSGVTDVTVLILDDATELTVERPATRLLQQRRDVPQPMQGC